MRMGTLLLGGILGAAAAIYVQRRAMPMLFSAMTSNSDSNFLNSNSKSSTKSKNNMASTTVQPSNFSNTASMNTGSQTNTVSNSKKSTLDESLFKEDGLNRVEDIVNKDPKLKAAVQEIISGSSANSASAISSSSVKTH